jgi:hypothetical protein
VCRVTWLAMEIALSGVIQKWPWGIKVGQIATDIRWLDERKKKDEVTGINAKNMKTRQWRNA